MHQAVRHTGKNPGFNRTNPVEPETRTGPTRLHPNPNRPDPKLSLKTRTVPFRPVDCPKSDPEPSPKRHVSDRNDMNQTETTYARPKRHMPDQNDISQSYQTKNDLRQTKTTYLRPKRHTPDQNDISQTLSAFRKNYTLNKKKLYSNFN